MYSASPKRSFAFGWGLSLFTLLVLPGTAIGEDSAPDLGWETTGRASLVSTSGNGDSLSAGLELGFLHRSHRSELEFATGGLLVRNQNLVREAIGSVDSFEIFEREEENDLAESAFFTIDFSQHLGRSLRWVTHLGWERNEPSGFSNRYMASIGLGWTTKTPQGHCWQSSLGLAWIRQEDLVTDEDTATEYPGLRLEIGFDRPIASTSTWGEPLGVAR